MDRAGTDRAPHSSKDGGRQDLYDDPSPDSSEALRFAHRMADEHLQIMVDIVCLERERETLREGSLAKTVLSRVALDLLSVRDASGAVVLDAGDPNLGALFHPDAPLALYLSGLLLWTRGIVHALRQLSTSLSLGQPAWMAARRHIDRVGAMHLAGLADDSLSHVEELCRRAQSPALGDAADRLVRFERELRKLVLAAQALGRTLRESFTLTPAR